MSILKERISTRRISRKSIIMILLLISFLSTSSTFAYWAGIVDGTQNQVTSSFVVGSLNYVTHEFTLDSTDNTYQYQVPIDYLLDNPEENINEVLFGLIWNDESLSDEIKDQIVSGEIELDFEIYMTNSKDQELGNKKYKRYSKLINIEIHEDNPEEIQYGENSITTGFTVSLNEEVRRNDYRNLAGFKTYIIINFDVNHDVN